MGRDAVPADALAKIEKLAESRHAREAVVVQAVSALGRLQAGLPAVIAALDGSPVDVEWAAILALAGYTEEGDAAKAARALTRHADKASGQSRGFALCALGDLASRLGPNSAARAAILGFLRGKDALLRRDNHARACAALALGVARDATAADAIAAILDDSTADDFAVGAACVSLGLLGATEHGDAILERVVRSTKWKPDARGYGALGLGLLGDTTKLDAILALAREGGPEEMERQLPLAIGLLGGRAECRTLADRFRRGWKTKDRHAASNAAFALTWVRDSAAVDDLVRLSGGAGDESVRALAAAALGYVGMRRPESPLARCIEGLSHRNRFGGWELLEAISLIL
jgi:HEAT repeat protein